MDGLGWISRWVGRSTEHLTVKMEISVRVPALAGQHWLLYYSQLWQHVWLSTMSVCLVSLHFLYIFFLLSLYFDCLSTIFILCYQWSEQGPTFNTNLCFLGSKTKVDRHRNPKIIHSFKKYNQCGYNRPVEDPLKAHRREMKSGGRRKSCWCIAGSWIIHSFSNNFSDLPGLMQIRPHKTWYRKGLVQNDLGPHQKDTKFGRNYDHDKQLTTTTTTTTTNTTYPCTKVNNS